MAVTVGTITRKAHARNPPLITEVITFTPSGTYATGGFAFDFTKAVAGPGNSPLTYKTVQAACIQDNAGYIYVLSNGTMKVFSAPGTELANGSALTNPVTGVLFVTA